MFHFIVRYFGFLKVVPFLPQLFDVSLRLYSFLFKPGISRAIDEIEQEIGAWPGVALSQHKYGGVQFNLGKKELGHIHGNGLVDIQFNRKIKEELVSAGLAEPHHILTKSGWISFYIRSDGDTDKVIFLFTKAKEWRLLHAER